MKEYKKLAKQTKVMANPQNLKANSKPKTTWKWRQIFKKTWRGIKFLPSDIISVQKELAYLLGEYQAGNTSATRNKIVAIADNLLKRKHITKLEYRKINGYITLWWDLLSETDTGVQLAVFVGITVLEFSVLSGVNYFLPVWKK